LKQKRNGFKMNKSNPVRVGLFGIGLETYWPQFPGWLDRRTGYQKQIAGKPAGPGALLGIKVKCVCQ